nr:MAG TPA: hypothetical protein [Caudoviricetes sp.]
MKKKIEIDGKKYTLTANRTIIKTICNIAPDLLKFVKNKNISEDEVEVVCGVDVMANLDILFYDMIKIVHKDITKEKSDEILDKFENEYEDVQTELINLAMSVFTTGDQKKKKIVWED